MPIGHESLNVPYQFLRRLFLPGPPQLMRPRGPQYANRRPLIGLMPLVRRDVVDGQERKLEHPIILL